MTLMTYKTMRLIRKLGVGIIALTIIVPVCMNYKVTVSDIFYARNSQSSTNNHANEINETKHHPLMDEKTLMVKQFVSEYMNNSRHAAETAIPLDITNTTILSWNSAKRIESIVSQSWEQNLFCRTINETRSNRVDPNLPIIVTFNISCGELYRRGGIGTGNYIIFLYGIRLAAYVLGNIDVYFTCTDADTTKNELLLPWMTGWFPARTTDTNISAPITIDDVCTGFSYVPLKYMYEQIQYDFRKMARELVGLPPKHYHHALSGKEVVPLQSDNETTGRVTATDGGKLVELDEAVIHFRCGDLMDSDNKGYGFMTFKGYTKHIPSNTKTIGIITQPFDDVDGGSGIQNRKEDASINQRKRCRIVVLSFVEYMQQQYPNASVKVRNTVGETITIAFSRMILSNTSIAGTSTFGLLASIAAFGTAYIRMPSPSVRFDDLTGNMVLFDEPEFISVIEMKQVWETRGTTGALQWFWNGTKQLEEKEIKI